MLRYFYSRPCVRGDLVLVMSSARDNDNVILRAYSIHKAVFLINTPAPIPIAIF